MSGNIRWTTWENQLVVEKVQKYPHNFQQAFDEAAKELGRSSGGVSQHFYKKIQPNLTENGIVVTATGSSHGVIVNSKNKARRTSERLEMVMSFVDLLTKEEKKQVATEIFKKM
jgi:spermidine synthase